MCSSTPRASRTPNSPASWPASATDGCAGSAATPTSHPPWARSSPAKERHMPAAATGRVALVTGAARGIGAATVAALAADGWRVVAVDRCADDPALPYALGTRAELDRVVAAADRGTGGAGSTGGTSSADGVIAAQADTRDPDALAAAVRLAEERWGGLDAAVAAAGVIAGGVPAWQVPPEREQAVLDIDLGGVLTLARMTVPALLRRPAPRHGRFLAVASAAATRG